MVFVRTVVNWASLIARFVVVNVDEVSNRRIVVPVFPVYNLDRSSVINEEAGCVNSIASLAKKKWKLVKKSSTEGSSGTLKKINKRSMEISTGSDGSRPPKVAKTFESYGTF